MKSIKELLASFKKQEPAKIQPKERKDHSLERFVDTHKTLPFELAFFLFVNFFIKHILRFIQLYHLRTLYYTMISLHNEEMQIP